MAFKRTSVLMAAVLSAILSLATGLAGLPTSLQDTQAKSCVTNEKSVTDGGGSPISESATIEIEQRLTETCSSNTLVTPQNDKDGQTTLNEEEDDYENEYEKYEYEKYE
jgi:hypothetical protein